MKPNEFLTLIEGYWKEKLTPENRRIYRKAVERFKPDDLRRTADTLIESCIFFPKIHDVLRVAREGLLIGEGPGEKPRDCPKCQGTTWVSVMVKHHRTGRQYQAVTSCSCTSREPAPAKVKPPKAEQRELTSIAEIGVDTYPD